MWGGEWSNGEVSKWECDLCLDFLSSCTSRVLSKCSWLAFLEKPYGDSMTLGESHISDKRQSHTV